VAKMQLSDFSVQDCSYLRLHCLPAQTFLQAESTKKMECTLYFSESNAAVSAHQAVKIIPLKKIQGPF